MFREQRLLLRFVRQSAAHVAHEMHDGVAMGDVGIELVERIAAEVLEILLHLHRDIVTRQIMDQQIAIRPELAGNGREKDADCHAPSHELSPVTLPHLREAEHLRRRRKASLVQRRATVGG